MKNIITNRDFSNHSARLYEVLYWVIGIVFFSCGVLSLMSAIKTATAKTNDNSYLLLIGFSLICALISGAALINVREARNHVQK